MGIRNAHIDIGKLAVNFRKSGAADLNDYLESELSGASTEDTGEQDVVLYGFGRIGRLLARFMLNRSGAGHTLRLRAIVVRKGKADNDLEKRASLLRRDSVHGSFKATIQVDYRPVTFGQSGGSYSKPSLCLLPSDASESKPSLWFKVTVLSQNRHF